MSKSKVKAILIPVSFKDEEKRYGSLMNHAIHLGKHEGVFWHVNIPGEKTKAIFQHHEIKKTYFYSTSVKKVLFTGKIKKIGEIDIFIPPSQYEKFVPEWRKDDWKASTKISHGFWILLESIEELIKPKEISDFKRFETKEELKHGAYPYALIMDPTYESV